MVLAASAADTDLVLQGDPYREGFERLPVASMLVAPGDREAPWGTTGASFSVERRCRLADGRVVPVQIDGALVGGGMLLAQLREIPERDHDPLTGLPERNR